MVGDNGGYEMDWCLPVAKCCGQLLGTERCTCPTCGVDATPRIHPLIELGEN